MANIVLEDINDIYAYGNLGEFNIIVMKENGYINATKICKEGGKEFFNWYANADSKNIIEEVEKIIKTKSTIKITGGSKNDVVIRGTYVHPLLITSVAHWISPKFAVKISLWIEEWKKFSVKNENKYWNAISKIKPSFNDKKEFRIKQILNKKLKGKLEVETDHGLIDILTKKEIIEVKTAKHYKYALGQILAYSVYYPKKDKVIYLFDLYENINIDKIMKLYDKYDVELRFCDDNDDNDDDLARNDE
jgi:hypothetical protein